jgi:hypothetical protein
VDYAGEVPVTITILSPVPPWLPILRERNQWILFLSVLALEPVQNLLSNSDINARTANDKKYGALINNFALKLPRASGLLGMKPFATNQRSAAKQGGQTVCSLSPEAAFLLVVDNESTRPLDTLL